MSEDTRVAVTKDEADREQFDGLKLTNPDPNYHYRWARRRDINIARHKWNGYEVVDSTTDKVRSILDDTTRMKKSTDVGTSIEIADDLVLMRMPRERHEQRLAERDAKTLRRTRTVASSYKQKVAAIAGPGLAYEEHRDNPAMKGMSEKAYERLLEERRQAAKEEARKRG